MQDLALVSLLGAQHVKKNDQNFPRIFPRFFTQDESSRL